MTEPTARHKRIATRLRLIGPEFRHVTPERVRQVDVLNDWQASHQIDAAILAQLDGRKPRKK